VKSATKVEDSQMQREELQPLPPQEKLRLRQMQKTRSAGFALGERPKGVIIQIADLPRSELSKLFLSAKESAE
jgi:hypothetical protein